MDVLVVMKTNSNKWILHKLSSENRFKIEEVTIYQNVFFSFFFFFCPFFFASLPYHKSAGIFKTLNVPTSGTI